jgi:hypothetical protein
MKKFISVIVISACSCGGSESKEEKEQVSAQPVSELQYTKEDLKKMKWIEGKWKGLYNGNPFYEIYQFANDSTLQITAYEWNGKDSSQSKLSQVSFKDGAYWLGEKQNWKVDSITDTHIKMSPNVEAYNDIVWRYKDSVHWDAILTSKNAVTTYNMEHFDPFKK